MASPSSWPAEEPRADLRQSYPAMREPRLNLAPIRFLFWPAVFVVRILFALRPAWLGPAMRSFGQSLIVAGVYNGKFCALDCRLLDMCCRGSHLERGSCLFDGYEEALLVQLREGLPGLYDVIEVDEYFGHPARKLRAYFDRDLRIDAAGCFDDRCNAAAFHLSGYDSRHPALPL